MHSSGAASKLQPRSRPGRPRNFDCETILDRALDTFWKYGYTNTTTRELENSLMLNQSSIYNSFGSKEQFYGVILDRYERLAIKALIEPMETPGAGTEDLKKYFVELSDWITCNQRRGCMLINTIGDDLGLNPEFGERTRRFKARIKAAFVSLLNNATAAKQLADGDNETRASLLSGLTLGLNLAARAESSQEEIEGLILAIHGQIDSWRKR